MSGSFPISGLLGRVEEQVPLASRTTWRIGGPARWLIFPAGVADLARLLAGWPREVPLLVLGGGSNLLLDDRGFGGGVVALTQGLCKIQVVAEAESTVTLEAQAGLSTRALAHYARRQGLAGVEFLGGIPGTLGGALRMNAGAYGQQMRDVLVEALLLTAQGERIAMTSEELALGYRQSRIPEGAIFVSARLRLTRDHPGEILQRMRRINQLRTKSQPLEHPSAGSTFKNPPQGAKTWQLIDAAGMRGVAIGGAQVSEKHSNFLINRHKATSREMVGLIEQVQERVAKTSGVTLQLEVGVLDDRGRLISGDRPLVAA
ncbi:MAG: UDP-N-acetylmuramate dehydrogenase [Magnetococcales bacterium]|nr:UDP-N-acetylmuramate dehydrogenase [Magnetococcales bacterium]